MVRGLRTGFAAFAGLAASSTLAGVSAAMRADASTAAAGEPTVAATAPYATVPMEILRDRDRVKIMHLRVYLVVAFYAGCFLRHEDIAARTGYHVERVGLALRDLVAWGYLEVERQKGDRRRRFYRVPARHREATIDFAAIPLKVGLDRGVKALELRTYGGVALRDRALLPWKRARRGCNQVQPRIAEITGEHPRKTSGALRRLVALGHLWAEEAGRRRVYHQTIYPAEAAAPATEIPNEGGPRSPEIPNEGGPEIPNEGGPTKETVEDLLLPSEEKSVSRVCTREATTQVFFGGREEGSPGEQGEAPAITTAAGASGDLGKEATRKERATPSERQPRASRKRRQRQRQRQRQTATIVALDWQPDADDVAFAKARGLSDRRIEEQRKLFIYKNREIWRVPRRDWSLKWREWVANVKLTDGEKAIAAQADRRREYAAQEGVDLDHDDPAAVGIDVGDCSRRNVDPDLQAEMWWALYEAYGDLLPWVDLKITRKHWPVVWQECLRDLPARISPDAHRMKYPPAPVPPPDAAELYEIANKVLESWGPANWGRKLQELEGRAKLAERMARPHNGLSGN